LPDFLEPFVFNAGGEGVSREIL